MSEWRTDESYGREQDLVGEIDVTPGHPATLRRIERLQFAVEGAPHDWQGRVALAQALAQNGEFDRSVDQLRTAVELVSERRALASVFFNLGICLENLDRWDEAASAYEQCTFLIPDLFWGHFNLGVCLQRAGNLPYALDELRMALALDASIPDIHQALVEAYREAGMIREAEQACLRLLEIDANSLWGTQALQQIRFGVH